MTQEELNVHFLESVRRKALLNKHFFECVWKNKRLAAKAAIAMGADVNAQNPMAGRTALHGMALADNVKMIKILLACKANVNQLDLVGNTPLDLAVDSGCIVAAKVLRAAGGKMLTMDNRDEKTGNTALHFNVQHRQIDIVMALAVAGADFQAKNNEGKTPLDLIDKEKHPKFYEIIADIADFQSGRASVVQKIAESPKRMSLAYRIKKGLGFVNEG